MGFTLMVPSAYPREGVRYLAWQPTKFSTMVRVMSNELSPLIVAPLANCQEKSTKLGLFLLIYTVCFLIYIVLSQLVQNALLNVVAPDLELHVKSVEDQMWWQSHLDAHRRTASHIDPPCTLIGRSS
jgi:hypothetical protein